MWAAGPRRPWALQRTAKKLKTHLLYMLEVVCRLEAEVFMDDTLSLFSLLTGLDKILCTLHGRPALFLPSFCIPAPCVPSPPHSCLLFIPKKGSLSGTPYIRPARPAPSSGRGPGL